MHLHFDEDLVEAAVFLCATGRCKGISPLQIVRFNRERESAYSVLNSDERAAAFSKLHLGWFQEWGLEKLLTQPLQEFPLLAGTLNILAFRRSRRKNEDGSELYVNREGERNGVISLCAERIQDRSQLTAFLRHELMHLHDMVDPGFGYSGELTIGSASPSQQRLARERYRLLWDVSIDGRLTTAGKQTIAGLEQRWREFTPAFSFWSDSKREEIFRFLWSGSNPSHREFEKWVCDPRQLPDAAQPLPGAPCPLCGFPTFSWATEDCLAEKDVNAIQADFPSWKPEHGICKRCCQVYHLRRGRSPLAAV